MPNETSGTRTTRSPVQSAGTRASSWKAQEGAGQEMMSPAGTPATAAAPSEGEAATVTTSVSYPHTFRTVLMNTVRRMARELEQRGHKYHTLLEEEMMADILKERLPMLAQWGLPQDEAK